MSTVLHPVGPRRARVYWVRRLLVVLVVVALAAVATTAVSWLRGREDPAAAAAGPAGGDSAAAVPCPEGGDATGTDATDATGDEDATTDEDAGTDAEDDATSSSTPVDCTPEALRLTLTSPEVEFEAAATPVLTATVTNVGDEPCTVDAGDATREVVVTSGDDRVWSTKDCATEESASRQLLLGAGAADTVDIEWPRLRSAEGCPADLPAPKAGTYQAVATLGRTTSQTVVFILG
jgi:hypothetical protein